MRGAGASLLTRFRPPACLTLETHAQYKRNPARERSQRNPEQFVHGSQSTARTLRVECHQLPTESQVFEDEVLAGTEGPEHPAEEMPGRRDHSQNLIGKVRIELFAKAFILQAYDVLARHRSDTTCRH
jgi:hypothetical protein